MTHKSEDYKISAVKYYINNNKSLDEVCEIFECSRKSLYRDEHKIQTAVDIIDNLSAKLSLYNNKDITLTQQTIDAINKEYQTFIQKKTHLTDHLKETHKKSINLLDEIELKTLNAFLSTHFSFLQSNSLKCNKCNKFIGTNKKSLAVHKRKCNSTTSDSNTE
jgi:predicted DNA-binding protein YlxM (UPF0122 family)